MSTISVKMSTISVKIEFMWSNTHLLVH